MNDATVPAKPCASQTFNLNGPPLFQLGRVAATPAALALLDRHGMDPLTLLNRHQRGDWGELGVHDQSANDAALVNGSRLLSAYVIKGERVWVITEAVGEDGATRAGSCILFPKEY